MRIMECDAKSMHIVTLMDETQASVTSGIQRMLTISDSMFQDVLSSLENQDPMMAKTTLQLEDDVDHFSYFMLRLLRRAALDPAFANQLDIATSDCLDYQTLVYRIEQIADSVSNIARHIVMLRERRLKLSEPLIKLMVNAGKNAHTIYDQAVEAFFSNSARNAEAIIEHGKLVDKSDQEIATWAFLHEKKNPVLICATCSIRESIKKVAEYGREIALYTIHRSFNPE